MATLSSRIPRNPSTQNQGVQALSAARASRFQTTGTAFARPTLGHNFLGLAQGAEHTQG